MPDLIIPPFQPTEPLSGQNTQETELVDSSDFSDFARGILGGIPEEDRNIVAKYVKEWDGNVTRKFQEIHQQYQPYAQLGPVEDLQYARYYASMMQNDPVRLIQELTSAMQEAGMDMSQLYGNNGGGEEYDQGQEPQVPAGFDPQLMSRIDQMEQALGGMYSIYQQSQRQQVEAQQMAQLDNLMQDMHSQHGDFDDDWFLLQLEKGKTPDQAIQAYQERFGSSGRAPAPRILTGNGMPRQNQVDPSRLSDQDRKAYALAILQANNNQ